MEPTAPNSTKLNFKAGDMICAAGECDYDLYLLQEGKLLVFVNNKSQITPLSVIEPVSYLGEFSFIDKLPRSAHVVCLEDSVLIKIPSHELEKNLPNWLISIAKELTKKLRKADSLIAKRGIRKKNVKTVPALSIEEQRKYYQILVDYRQHNSLA